MPKFGSYTALAAASVDQNDLMILDDVSATATKKITMQDVIDGAARASNAAASGIVRYDGTTITITGTTLAIAGKQTITSSNAAALAVGLNGATNPAFTVDASTGSSATGVKVKSAAAAGRAALSVTSSGADEGLDIDAKGAGTIRLGNTSTGNVAIQRDVNMASTTAICDANGNELLQFPATVGSAVNEFTVTNAAAGGQPELSATGGDTDIAIKITAKGTGDVRLTNPQLRFPSAGILADTNGNELLKFPATVGSAVNEMTLTNAATGAAPSLAASGGDTNISLTLTPKGTGVVQGLAVVSDKRTVTSKTVSATLTAAEVMTGIIRGNPGAASQTYTLPTAALLVGGIANAKVGDSFKVIFSNIDGANSYAVAAGSGGTGRGTLTIPANQTREVFFNLTNVGGGTEAYDVYGLD